MAVFYKFPDEDTFKSLDKPEVSIDVIGSISVQDEEGNLVVLQGYHVNALKPIEQYKEYEVQVNSPVRIYG